MFEKLLEQIESSTIDKSDIHLTTMDHVGSLFDIKTKSTLLHYSASSGKSNICQQLIDHGCDVNAVNNSGETPLMLAIKKPDEATISLLLRNKANIFTNPSTLQWTLHHAVSSLGEHGRQRYESIVDTLVVLIDKCYTLNKKLTTKLMMKNDPLDQFFVVAFANVELAKILLDNGYDVETREPTMQLSAQHCATIFGRSQNVKLLRNRSAIICPFVNYTLSSLRYYLLYFEIADANSQMLRRLLTYNPTVYLPDKTDNAEVEYLLRYGNTQTKKVVLMIGLYLLSEGQDNNVYLTETDYENIAFLLLQYNVDPQSRDPCNGIPLIQKLYFRRRMIPFLAKLAINVTCDDTKLTDLTHLILESNPLLGGMLDSFMDKLTDYINTVFYKKLTFFQLLTEGEQKLVSYAKNIELRDRFLDFIQESRDSYADFHFNSILRKKINNAILRAHIEDKVVSVLEKLTGLEVNEHYNVLQIIFGYLSFWDLENLNRVGRIL